ncbi:Hypothetical protein AKI40_4113 [Enterobacter sp. FY-07]|nr:Hypothetical protein AKI40_4113 [Enterobacter sp. FY-07]
MRDCGNRVGRYFANYRANARNTDDKDQPVGEDSKEKIGDGAGGDNSGALADCFIVKCIMTHLRCNRLDTLIQHFDITAQRNKSDNEFGAVFIRTAPERFTKTNGKALNPHSAAASNPEMAKFMHGDQHTKCNDERRQIPENAQHKTFR